MTNLIPASQLFNGLLTEQSILDQLKRAELFNGRAAMVGILIECCRGRELNRSGHRHQIGLGFPCRWAKPPVTPNFLPFCFEDFGCGRLADPGALP